MITIVKLAQTLAESLFCDIDEIKIKVLVDGEAFGLVTLYTKDGIRVLYEISEDGTIHKKSVKGA